MDLQTRKLNIIEYLIGMKDEKLFDKIESMVQDGVDEKRNLKPFTKKQLLERAEKSNEDHSKGRVISQEELEAQSEKW